MTKADEFLGQLRAYKNASEGYDPLPPEPDHALLFDIMRDENERLRLKVLLEGDNAWVPTLKEVVLGELFSAREKMLDAKLVPERRLKRQVSFLHNAGVGTGVSGAAGMVGSAIVSGPLLPFVLLGGAGVAIYFWGNNEADLAEREIEEIDRNIRAIDELRRVLLS